jgi:hypothetical protein
MDKFLDFLLKYVFLWLILEYELQNVISKF